MNSRILGNTSAAAASASQQQLQRVRAKSRLQYDLPKKPAHLNDRAARRSHGTLLNQFFQTGRSLTPPLGATNWAPRNNLLISVDGTEMAGRMEGSSKDRNTTTAGSLPPVTIRVSSGYGGEEQSRAMMRAAIFSGQFDEILGEYDQKRSLRSFKKPNSKVVFADAASQNKREFAGRQRSADEIAADPAIGVIRDEPRTMADFHRLVNR